MSINPSTQYPGRITAPDANYTYGSSKNESAPGVGDGTPYEIARANDIFGFQQALLRAAGIVPNGSAETQLVSEYMQAIVELASGRAYNYDESGVVNAYVLDLRTNQQGPRSLYAGLEAEFIPTIDSTGASTVNVNNLGVKALVNNAGSALLFHDLVNTRSYRIRYDGAAWRVTNLALITSGNWAPKLWDNTNSDAEGQTYNAQEGTWTRVGNRGFITGYLGVNSLGTLNAAEQVRIAGIPFTSNTSSETNGSVSMGFGSSLALPGADNNISGSIFPNTTYIRCYVWDSVAGPSPLTIGQLSAGGILVFQGQYPILV